MGTLILRVIDGIYILMVLFLLGIHILIGPVDIIVDGAFVTGFYHCIADTRMEYECQVHGLELIAHGSGDSSDQLLYSRFGRTWRYGNELISAVSSEEPSFGRILHERFSRRLDGKIAVKVTIEVVNGLHPVYVREYQNGLLTLCLAGSDKVI